MECEVVKDHSMNSDSERSQSEDENETPITDITQLHRAQNAQFETLLSKRALQGGPTTERNRTTRALADSELTLASLVGKHDLTISGLDPRAYQIELFERAKTRNIIAVLDTGSGKTLIAVLLLKHILQQELVDRALGKPPRVAFFLVDSVTLVFQQTAVLRNNLDQNIASLYGAMGPDLWEQQTWDNHFNQNMVIVCTAEILNQCLLNAFLSMKQINLLIIDEAHHTKKEHPYARIVREFYVKADLVERPKIFGMTASPIDSKGNPAEAALQLEALLDSQIATTSHLTLLRQIVRKPREETWTYKKLNEPFHTELSRILSEKFGDIKALEPVFRFTWKASSELGRWCADRVWTQALVEDVIPKLEGIIGKETTIEGQAQDTTQRDIERTREARRIVSTHTFGHPLDPGQLSPKVELLLSILTQHFGESEGKKCIVFTQQRNTAKTLLQLTQVLNIPNLRPGLLVGVRRSDLTGKATFRNQFLALVRFRQGDFNCLFATSVAEEGLDIPDCNLVIRFNLYDTLIQYIQSRGRARHANSTYACMIELGNDDHKARLQEIRQAENLMHAFCKALPQDRLLGESDYDMEPFAEKDKEKRTFVIPSTGARLTYRHAVDILDRYASSLQYENDGTKVNYVVMQVNKAYCCEIILPEKSPIRGVIGGLAGKKSLAKQSAAFDTCMVLRRSNLLDDHFRSIYHKRLPAMRNAKLAIVSNKSNQYPMICKPSIWAREQGSTPVSLYGTLIKFMPSKPLHRGHSSLMLLSRERLPSFPEFPVYLDNDTKTQIETLSLKESFQMSSEELLHLSHFTLVVLHDLFHKTFDPKPERFPYWLAPIQPRLDVVGTNVIPSALIDWETLLFVKGNPELRWTRSMSSHFLLNHFIYDPWDGRRRYFPQAIDSSLSPSDPPPEYVPKRRWMQDIMNYTLSLSKNSRKGVLESVDLSQPVLQAECISLRRNFLDVTTEAEKAENTRTVICPQLLTISPIPLSTVTSCLAFPAIITRLESYLIAQEGCQALGLEVELKYALEALTKDSDNNDDHRALQIHVQRGMGKNYERLEFLGDSFLKMATSISLFCQKPDNDEYDYHVNRMCLICNKNLFNTAVKLQLFKYIRSRGFSRNSWYPPGLQLLHGRNFVKHLATESTHNLAEKTIADVCEALIAASLLSGGKQHRFDEAVRAVTLFVNSENHAANSWADYTSSYEKPAYQVKGADGAEQDLANKIFERLGYRFKYPRLLRSAFTHPSYPSAWAKVPCYQRLEFLGDSLLEMVCIEDIFHRFPDKDPQWLTEHKMAIVSNKFLGALAVKLGFHRHLQHFSSPIQASITHYAEIIQMAEAESHGAMDYWIGTKDPPKCLPDMLEAYLASIFVDSDFDYDVVEEFYSRHIKPFFMDMSLYDTFANKHPVTYLHTQLTNVYGCTNYCLKAGEFPAVDGEQPTVLAAVMVHGVSVAEALGTSGRYAKLRASQLALKIIKGMLRVDFRRKFGCICSVDDSEEAGLEMGTAI